MKLGINTKHFYGLTRTAYYISGTVNSLVCQRPGSPAIEPRNGIPWTFQISHVHIGKIIARAFWMLRQFWKRVIFQKKSTSCSRPDASNQGPLYGQPVAQPTKLYRDSLLTGKYLYLSTCLISNPWCIFSPCNMFMCTNKTCFAGVGTWPKPIFRIRISCLSYPCESKQIQNFRQQIRLRFPV